MSLLNDLTQIIPDAKNRLAENALMSDHSTFRIGGPADVFFEPVNDQEIAIVSKYCLENGIPLTILGNGSNVLVSDSGIRGVVMIIGDNISGIERRQDMILAKAGTRLSALAAFAAQNGLAGLEFASGIPGTLGGAIIMNAGAYDHCMAEVVVLTEFLNEKMSLQAVVREEHEFAYRRSCFSDRNIVVLQACLQLTADEPQAIFDRMADLVARRRASQPLEMPSAGSAFKRPVGHFAGKLIADCGLKGCRVGNAQVSEKHAGFIVNLGMASAMDTRNLILHIQNEVFQKTGIHLEPEVRFVGDWQNWQEQRSQGEE